MAADKEGINGTQKGNQFRDDSHLKDKQNADAHRKDVSSLLTGRVKEKNPYAVRENVYNMAVRH
jgi:hypothetical protein